MSELHRVGVNLNQLTRLANTTGDMPALAELRAIRVCSKPPCATPSIYDPAWFLVEGIVSIWTQRSSCQSSNPAASVFVLMRRAIATASASFSQDTPCI
jgi:hypothetical protein